MKRKPNQYPDHDNRPDEPEKIHHLTEKEADWLIAGCFFIGLIIGLLIGYLAAK